jgi:hypothetical protein
MDWKVGFRTWIPEDEFFDADTISRFDIGAIQRSFCIVEILEAVQSGTVGRRHRRWRRLGNICECWDGRRHVRQIGQTDQRRERSRRRPVSA